MAAVVVSTVSCHGRVRSQIYYDSKAQAGLTVTAKAPVTAHAAPTPIRASAARATCHQSDPAATVPTPTGTTTTTTTTGAADRTVGPALGQVGMPTQGLSGQQMVKC